MRERNTWIPFYMIILFFTFYKFSLPKASLITIGLILTIVSTDFISSQVIKKAVKRLRPCQTHLYKMDNRDSLVHCGNGYSFPSSHAANHFALAFYMIFTGMIRRKFLIGFFIIWASTISFAQVYVGLHYPFDILAGMIFGTLMALLFGAFTKRALHILKI
ncbi:MAG: phosphatase PAP2 family protein [Saprospiraceae bacterium]